MSRSLSLLVPALMGHDANLMLAAAGMGERNFRTLCYDTGGLMIGLHDWQEAGTYTNIPEPEDGWAAHDLTASRVAQITASMVVADLPYSGLEASYDEFADLASSEGVTWGELLPRLPAPGSMATVTKDEFYRTDQPGFPVVKIVQTHVLNDPNHDDLRLLLALYEAQRDPFNPEPWVPSQGSAGVYPTKNLIGGPQLATHNDKLWRNDFAGNSYEPGVYGWVEVQP